MTIAVKKVSEHELIHEEEDVFIYRFGRGTVTADQIAQLSELERKEWPQLSYVYSVTSLHSGLSISPGALTRAAKLFQYSPPRTSAFVVRGHYLRTSMEFMLRTLRLLGATMEIAFFEEEQSAQEWIAEKKRQKRA